MLFNLKTIIFLILGILTSVLVFYVLLQEISFHDVIQILKEVELQYILAFIVLSLAGSAFRTWRYILTLRPAGYRPNIALLYLTTIVRNLFSDLLPARIGTTVYIYIANTKLGIPLTIATNSFAISLIFDFVALGPLVILALLFSPHDFHLPKPILYVASLVIFVLTSLIVYLIPVISKKIAVLIKLAKFLPTSFSDKISSFFAELAKESRALQKSGVYFNIFTLSALIRICKYGSLYVFLVGMLLPLGYKLSDINPISCIIGILAAEMAASLPVSGIAGFGAYEGAWAFTFNLLGFPKDISNLTAIAHHLFTQAWGYGIGLIAMALLIIPYKIKSSKITGSIHFNKIKDSISQLIIFLAVLFLVYILLNSNIDNTPRFSTEVSKNSRISDRQKNKLQKLSNVLSGNIFFDSNRSGTFGIYKIDTKEFEIKPIVDDLHWHEMYPDISPDRTMLVYSRSRSLARVAPSEIWLYRLDGSKHELLAKSGAFPTFSSDGKYIYYEFERKSVIKLDLNSRSSEEIFPKRKKYFYGNSIVKPRISKDEKYISFTSDKPSTWHAWYWPLGKGKGEMIASGCEPGWFPNNNLFWIKRSGANAGSGIMHYDLIKNKNSILKDDGGPFGHEYFPSLTDDGKFLLYSASPESQHDHNTSNYQIYVYELSSGETYRLTYDKYNNRWPKYR
jgi:uncharacterized protein (TIRG00374 family)